MEADISGTQRKVVTSSVRPTRLAHGAEGIALRDGKTLPFAVLREWSAPAGYYPEQWFLVAPDSKEVLFEGPVQTALIWGLQSLTPVEDVVTEAVSLSPGRYLIVFALGGVKGGEIEVVAADAPAEEAA